MIIVRYERITKGIITRYICSLDYLSGGAAPSDFADISGHTDGYYPSPLLSIIQYRVVQRSTQMECIC